jgi:hypothetical protein
MVTVDRDFHAVADPREPRVERQAFVTSKGKHLSRGSGHIGHSVRNRGEDEDTRHCCSAAFGSGGVVEYLDKWVAGWGRQHAIQIAQCV